MRKIANGKEYLGTHNTEKEMGKVFFYSFDIEMG